MISLGSSGQMPMANSNSFGASADSAPVLTIREKQKGKWFWFIEVTNTFFSTTDALKVMLNLNLPISTSVAQEPVWKLFIYDRCGQDIVSPLLSIKELRDLGVTLHMYVKVFYKQFSNSQCFH